MATRIALGTTAKDLAALALGTSTTETSFQTNGLIVGSVTAIAVAPAILSTPNIGDIPSVLDSGIRAGSPFTLTAWGICTTGVSTNLTLKLYQVPFSILGTLVAGSVASCNLLATSTARAVNTTTKPWFFSATLQWNAVKGILEGSFIDQIGNLLDTLAVTTETTLATLNDNELNFILSATLSSGNAANVVTCACFNLTTQNDG
jgi:hypothetical protein